MAMMDDWKSRKGFAALMVWLMITVPVWTGCGPNVSLDLPNGYAIHVLNARDTALVEPEGSPGDIPPNGTAIGRLSVDHVDAEGDLVFGSLRDPEDDSFTTHGYFLLDTGAHTYTVYQHKEVWGHALHDQGVTQIDLRWPSAFWRPEPQVWRWRLVSLSGFLVVLTLLWLFIRTIAKHERQVRRERLGRL